ncbi:hypothetical protein RDG67_002801 [Vibrio cholerae]|nr:hypothetical protein [Vibrio cholerae]
MSKLDKLKKSLYSISANKTIGVPTELVDLYLDLNGFIGLEGALLGFPVNVDMECELFYFNRVDSWKIHYNQDVRDTFFFATDIFCHLFGIYSGRVVKFNPETGIIKEHSESLEEWASTIISDYDYETGWSLASGWQKNNRILQCSERLLPKIPFSLGGEFVVENLTPVTLSEAMLQYSKLYEQVKNIRQGDVVKIYKWLERER